MFSYYNFRILYGYGRKSTGRNINVYFESKYFCTLVNTLMLVLMHEFSLKESLSIHHTVVDSSSHMFTLFFARARNFS